ncbi:alpha/beta fold hydrolase [Legionella sp. CNM-1927-20]|uniref:alpha/beta fold hydrolase n=1 Tax=Legionella sp. CNM-1927-20 TaxID=3422221 RepID=UPI00403AB9D1
MPKENIPYLLDETLRIHNFNINCKVVGIPGSANDSQPYILVIPGGPGYGLNMYKYFVYAQIAKASAERRPLPHFILYDPLGCGKSDKAKNPQTEYTVEHFTEMDASLVETIKERLNIKKLNLVLCGRSFGHMVAMNFPLCRPQWLEPSSDIHIQKILSIVGANGVGNKEYARHYLRTQYANSPALPQMQAAEEKLFSGSIQDQTDFVKHFIVPMAFAYSPEAANSLLMRGLLTFISSNPSLTVTTLKSINSLLQTFGVDNEGLNTNITTVAECSLDVLNHFFKTDFNNFDTIDRVRKNIELYRQIPICLITSYKDHMIDPSVAEQIHALLPDTSCTITFTTAHIITKKDTKDFYNDLTYDFLIESKINPDMLKNNTAIHDFKTTPYFSKEKRHPFSALITSHAAEISQYQPIPPLMTINKVEGNATNASLITPSVETSSSKNEITPKDEYVSALKL